MCNDSLLISAFDELQLTDTIGIAQKEVQVMTAFVSREQLHRGDEISYSFPNAGNLVLHGSIIHIGLGHAARHAVWIRCTDGYNRGNIECVMLENIMGVVSHA